MLIKLELENFYSIRDRHVLDLRVPGTTPPNDRFLQIPGDPKIRLPATVAIFGANASGKTSVLRALAFIEHFVTRSFENYKVQEELLIDPFSTSECEKRPIHLSVEFYPAATLNEKHYYEYSVSVSGSNERNFVSAEKLTRREVGASTTELVFCLTRKKLSDKPKIEVGPSFELKVNDPRREVRSNVSLISSLSQFGHDYATKLRQIFAATFDSNVLIEKVDFGESYSCDFLASNKESLAMLNHKIRSIDIGIEGVRIEKINDKNIFVFQHRGLDRVKTLYFESQGTQGFVKLFPFLAHALGNGSCAILDEADADLHPMLVGEIMRWFLDKSENRIGGQLVTSCNSASVLNLLVKEEVWMCHKGPDGATSVTPLSDYKYLRRDSNLYRLYMGGVFGAVPQFG